LCKKWIAVSVRNDHFLYEIAGEQNDNRPLKTYTQSSSLSSAKQRLPDAVGANRGTSCNNFVLYLFAKRPRLAEDALSLEINLTNMMSFFLNKAAK